MSKSFFVPYKPEGELTREQRDREARRAQAEQLSGLRLIYAALKKRESELVGILSAMCLSSDIPKLIAADAELNMIRRVLETAPAEVRASYRAPVAAQGAPEWEQERCRSLAAEVERIERHELPALEAKLDVIPTARELGMWVGHHDPREKHYNLINEQIAAKRARIVECRAELARSN